MEVKFATLNFCLGLKYKKLMVEKIMNTNKIDILCLQEVDLEVGYCEYSLSIPGYDLLIEKSSIKARSGIFISNRVNYTRKSILEGVDSHIVIIDIEGKSDINRIINVYRCFNPEGNYTAREKFRYK